MKVTTIKWLALLAGGLIFAPSVLSDCKCLPAENGETTHWCGNEDLVVIEEKAYRQIRGRIQVLGGRPVEHALVEILDKPDYLLDPKSNPRQVRSRAEESRSVPPGCRWQVLFSELAFRNI